MHSTTLVPNKQYHPFQFFFLTLLLFIFTSSQLTKASQTLTHFHSYYFLQAKEF